MNTSFAPTLLALLAAILCMVHVIDGGPVDRVCLIREPFSARKATNRMSSIFFLLPVGATCLQTILQRTSGEATVLQRLHRLWQKAVRRVGNAGIFDASPFHHVGTEPSQGNGRIRPERGLAREPDRSKHGTSRRRSDETDHVRGQAVGSNPGSESGNLSAKARPEIGWKFVPSFIQHAVNNGTRQIVTVV